MKNRTLAIWACLICLVLSILAPLLIPKPEERSRYHQHLSAKLRPEDEVEDGTFNTHLPLIMIETNAEIPGEIRYEEDSEHVIRDADGYQSYTMAEDGSKTIHGDLKVVDHEDVLNRPTDEPDISTGMEIRLRGNSSRRFDKKNYYIRLKDEDGGDRNEALLGMDAHHEWALHGPILDKTLLRNYMWYNISGEIMDYAPNVRFCEVMLNGDYIGVYVLTEMITAGKDGSRLPLTIDRKGDTFSGYLLRMDRIASEDRINSFSDYAYIRRIGMEIVYPGAVNCTPHMRETIRQEVSDFEKSLYSYDYDSDKWGFRKWIDTESFADYFIINEFTSNYDAGSLSTYLYKATDDRYRMCVWDFNNSCENYQENVQQGDYQHFVLQEGLWFFMLMKDKGFTKEVVDRYRYLRKHQLNTAYLEQYIDDVIAYLGPAIDRNYEVWGYSFEEEHDLLNQKDRNPRSFEEAVGDLKTYIETRGSWMDENIDALWHYSNTSYNKEFSEVAN